MKPPAIMRLMPVSARRLRRASVRLPEQLILASLLPCIDRTGSVRQVLVVGQTPRDAWLIPWQRELVHVPLLGPIQLRRSLSSMHPITAEQVVELRALWYFDPKHVAAGAVTDPEWARGEFDSANAAGRFTKHVKMVYFRRDLARVSMTAIASGGGIQLALGWRSDLLADRPKPTQDVSRRPRSARTEWLLDPIWSQ